MILKRLRESRENTDLRQKAVAKAMGIKPSTVSGWETGKDTIPLRRLIAYANLYRYSLDYLFGISLKNDTSSLPIKINLKLISKNLRLLRKRNKFTQLKVAKRINTTQSGYAHYENAVNLIPTSFLYNLTKIYQPFSIDAIFGSGESII